MTVLIIILSVFCIIEVIIVFLLYNSKKNSSKSTIHLQHVVKAFEANGYKIDELTKENLTDYIRMFKLQAQNDEYERAERRVIENMESILKELWRLKIEDNDKTADNILIRFENTLHLNCSDEKIIRSDQDTKYLYDVPDDIQEGKNLTVYKPYWKFKNKILIKGFAK